MIIEKRLSEHRITLPEAPKPAARYLSAVCIDNFIFVSGQTPKCDNELVYKGKLGVNLSIDDGVKASQIAILRSLSAIQQEISDLDRIERIIKLTGYVNCCDDFYSHSQVIDGASELLEKIFLEKGKHVRVAIGVNSLPGNAAVEIELLVKLKPE